MARTVYHVVLHHGAWMVKLGQIHTGPYKSQKDAILAAIGAAKATNDQGAYVRVQGPDNKFQTGWTYGRDPLPIMTGGPKKPFVRRTSNAASGIVGERAGAPSDERSHFGQCPHCSQAVDKRDLGQVLHHEQPGHTRLPTWRLRT